MTAFHLVRSASSTVHTPLEHARAAPLTNVALGGAKIPL